MCTITIDTTKSEEVTVTLIHETKKFIKNKTHQSHSSQLVLPIIEALLQENSMTAADITKIYVHMGPGSFTGLRVGAVIAGTLGFLLHTSINDTENSKPMTLLYERDNWV